MLIEAKDRCYVSKGVKKKKKENTEKNDLTCLETDLYPAS